MKTILTTLLALTGSLVLAQKHSSLNRSINDDGKTLSIRVNGTINGEPIDYNRTFDVANLTKEERDALRVRVLDSLNVSMPEPPKAPVAPRAPQAPRLRSESVTIISGDEPTVVARGANDLTMAVGGKNPYTKEVKYNSESGELYLRYRFQKDGEEITYERTLNARDKSKEERLQLIEGIEKEIGVPAKSR
ncbi:hypothetical protein GCM10028806_60970 [Spirosoma terrae]|uniref:Uncharacterized protein n=1 Tax=Spirosoma terrae TaxID=1968276 RepID=A0A6L9LH93_9BACT|nr:hypothetical protein [Spirosoma terrae]NDU99107.1 hypothetical protein [Spirosoma terrae]